ncbi:MAG: hypothetical protein GXP46_09915 [Deferribacteres bacterium]|nr:hypothetical protein [Deferribacteres bacterium]
MTVRASPAGRVTVSRTSVSVFLVSCAVIMLQLALMRLLSVTRWSHFSYFVISTALLGYGISGTLLSFAGERLLRRFRLWMTYLCMAMAVSTTAVILTAAYIPIDMQYLLYSKRELALFAACNILILVPFLSGATAIGLALKRHEHDAPLIYGCSMLGTAAGGAAAVGLMFLLPEKLLVTSAALTAWAAGVVYAGPKSEVTVPRLLVMLAAGLLIIYVPTAGITLKTDQYKTLAWLQDLEAQGDAEHMLTRYSPRGRLDVYRSPLLHFTLFAGLGATGPPPPQLAILRDGELAGTVYRIGSPDDAPILDHTPSSFPYRLMDRPRVLLLGETGGVNVWLARRFRASHITVVQPDPAVVSLMQGPLRRESGDVFTGPDVTVVTEEPRLFLERTREKFDIIQIVTAEGFAAGTAGLQSLYADFLLTTDGISLAWKRLTPRGMIAVTRGIQTPPRDSFKLFATFAESLGRSGVDHPESNLACLRNYLAAVIIAFREPVTAELAGSAVEAVNELNLDVQWFPHLMKESTVSAGAGGEADAEKWVSLAAGMARLSRPDRQTFYAQWVYNIRPATDDRPYFYDFFRWRSLPWLMDTYGRNWFRRLETGYAVLVLVLIEVIAIGAVLIILPLFRLKRAADAAVRGKLAVCIYFLLLGLAFMALEMASIIRFTKYLGDPVYAASLMIGCFLFSAGTGSILINSMRISPGRAVVMGAAGVVLLGGLHIFFADTLMGSVISSGGIARAAMAVFLTAPAGFFMGWLFPSGLRILSGHAGQLIPWAWGINGFASVAAPPLALMLSMSYGLRFVMVSALGLYVIAALVSLSLPGVKHGRGV